MINNLKSKILNLKSYLTQTLKHLRDETELLAIGSMLSNQQLMMNSTDLNDYEFRIFSQWGDDGIIQYLIKNVPIQNTVFIEFGVEDFAESNTRFLMMNNNWTGFVMDGSSEAMRRLENKSWFWKYALTYRTVFITKDNINQLLNDTGYSNIGLLSIDLDGNDYHIFKEIDLSKLNPLIIVMEYNSVFGLGRSITVPYRDDFMRTKAHFSNLYFGASLEGLNHEAKIKGYSLVGCSLAGNNAFFVRNDLLNEKVRALDVKSAYKESKFRESRNTDSSLSFLNGKDRYEIIKGLAVMNVETGETEIL